MTTAPTRAKATVRTTSEVRRGGVRTGPPFEDTAVFQKLLQVIATPIWIFDIERRAMVWGNAAACRVWQAADVGVLRARDFASDMSVTVATKLDQYRSAFETSDAVFSEIWTHYPLGKPSTMRISYRGIRLDDGRMAMLCEGCGEYNETPDKLRSAEALVHTSVMISLHNEAGQVLYRNPAATAADPGVDSALRDRFVDQNAYRDLQFQLQDSGQATVVAEMRTLKGRRWHEITARDCLDPVTGTQACLSSEVDVTELKTTEADARHAACHDPLTNLPNRVFVQTAFEQGLRDILFAERQAALLFIDIDRFKTINDSLGHSKGDQLLVEMAKRLLDAIGDTGQVARLGGDEFLVLLDTPPGDGPMHAADKVREAIEVPLYIGEHHLRLTASIGLSVAPNDGTDVVTLMKNADAAMYEAKKNGRNRCAVYQPTYGVNALKRMKLEIDLRRDFDDRLLELYYQPRICVRTGSINGAEVLLRWPHATAGFVPPDVFIPLAEDIGLISQIGSWLLGRAARQQVIWRDMGFPLRISINLSPRQFADGTLVEDTRRAIEEAGAEAKAFEFEITERLLLGDEPHVAESLDRLKGMGFAVSIDDFGTGYSNLAQLQRQTIDCLKVDRSFVSLLHDESPILEMIIQMCQVLNVKIVAEGVETQAQLEWLAARNCDEYQGFLYSPAVPADQFLGLLLKERGSLPRPKSKRVA